MRLGLPLIGTAPAYLLDRSDGQLFERGSYPVRRVSDRSMSQSDDRDLPASREFLDGPDAGQIEQLAELLLGEERFAVSCRGTVFVKMPVARAAGDFLGGRFASDRTVR